jgi:dolichol kinase
MPWPTEIKRKLFHHLPLLYMGLYAAFPRWVTQWLLFLALVLLSAVEFLRIRRPEINAWFLARFGGIHRPAEVLHASGIYWTLLGCWATMVIFTNRKIVLAAMGFLVFGDTVAALVGQKYGRKPWPMNPSKTLEGSGGFALASLLWGLLFVRWPVAVLGAAAGAWVEARPLPWNDNFWIPLLSALFLSVCNLVLGRH